MKYTQKYDVWQDLVTGEVYTKEYSFRPIVAFDINGNTVKGYVYSRTEIGVELSSEIGEETDYPASCFGQNVFLTDEQVAVRFKYLGNVEHIEDIDKSIKHYTEEECNFDNKIWLAKNALFDLTRKSSGGLSQCVHAKILEFFMEKALGNSEEEMKIKNMYYNKERKITDE